MPSFPVFIGQMFSGDVQAGEADVWWRKSKSTEQPAGNLDHLEVLRRIFTSLTVLISLALIRNLFLLELRSWKCFRNVEFLVSAPTVE